VIDDVMDAERGIVLRFEGYETRPLAEELRGHVLTISEDERRQLEEDEYWPDDLVGLMVVDQAGETVGVVTSVIDGPAQERLAIRTESGLDMEIPFVSALVTDVDLELRTVTIDVIPGLIEG
jgi:16S rRNA processing protein RimM